MSNKKISELTAILGDDVADDDLVDLVDSSDIENKKITVLEMMKKLGLVADGTNSESGSVVICTPMYAFGSGTMKMARANALATSVVLGLVLNATVAASGVATIRTCGVMKATTGQWDAVTGESGGLAYGKRYYVSTTTAGLLVPETSVPTTDFLAEVGVALSTTRLLINIKAPIQLS